MEAQRAEPGCRRIRQLDSYPSPSFAFLGPAFSTDSSIPSPLAPLHNSHLPGSSRVVSPSSTLAPSQPASPSGSTSTAPTPSPWDPGPQPAMDSPPSRKGGGGPRARVAQWLPGGAEEPF